MRFGLNWSPRTSALVALALYTSAYQAEILRAGLATVPLELVESARLMGSPPYQVYLLIKMRYVLRVMLPAFTGQAISLFKDTSVVVVIGVAEVMTIARMALGADVTQCALLGDDVQLCGRPVLCHRLQPFPTVPTLGTAQSTAGPRPFIFQLLNCAHTGDRRFAALWIACGKP